MSRLRGALRRIKCLMLIQHYRLRRVHSTAYIMYGSSISRDLVACEYVFIGDGCKIGRSVSIGAYSMMGPSVMCLGDDHRFDLPGVPSIFSGRPALRPTVIGRDVWIGAGAIVLSGVEIGDGAIVAAGTVVSSNVPPCEVHGGVPNRKIRDRFQKPDDKRTHLDYLQLPPLRGEFAAARY